MQSISHLKIITLIFLLSLTYAWTPEAESDQVKELEGYMNFTEKFEMFSGYLQLQNDPLINIHYIFVTSTNKPLSDDLVLWLNGGPGCSSLFGFSQEIGPNKILPGSASFSNYFNPYSWNQKANLLFFQSPPGVGFSINNDSSYIYNQSRTASGNTAALKMWFTRFPQFKPNKFWISGQSYCGMYIPSFANDLIDANSQWPEKINFKGILIGNGVMVTNPYWRRQARNKFYSKHYFYGTQIDNLIKSCSYNESDDNNPTCIKGNQLADEAVNLVNPYATIGICYAPKTIKYNSRRFWYAPFFQQNNPIITQGLQKNSITCTDDEDVMDYFNSQKVKEQLHIDPSKQWQACNRTISGIYNKGASTIQIFQKLKRNNLKILLFSGNTDVVVSYVETYEYIKQIGWKQIAHQTPFSNDRNSLMGWWTQYDGLTLAIINGAGHMVASDKPHAAYQMFANFISRQ